MKKVVSIFSAIIVCVLLVANLASCSIVDSVVEKVASAFLTEECVLCEEKCFPQYHGTAMGKTGYFCEDCYEEIQEYQNMFK